MNWQYSCLNFQKKEVLFCSLDGEQIIIMGTVFKNVPTNSLIPLDENPFFNKKKTGY